MELQTLSDNVVGIIMPRVLDELKARYFYEIASSWCAANGYENAGRYFLGESEQESKHYQKWIKFLSDWNVKIKFPTVDPSGISFASLMDILGKQYEIEYNLGEAYKKDAVKMFSLDQNAYKIIQEFVDIQNESVIESNNFVTKAYKYLPTDKNLVLFEENTFE